MTGLIRCEACKQKIPPFYGPGWILSTEEGRIHRECVPLNFKICTVCQLKALPIEIMKTEGMDWYCPDCWDGKEHGPKED